MQSVLIIGLGSFGWHLAINMTKEGMEVLAVDSDEDAVARIAAKVTSAQVGDCMDAAILSSIGVGNFDVCYVCIRDDFQSSVEITSNLKEMGAAHIVCLADGSLHAKALLRVGADEVIYPERDLAIQTAAKFSKK